MDDLKTSESLREAIERYDNSLDKYMLRMPKGFKSQLEKIADEKGMYTKAGKPSVNQLLVKIITEYLNKYNS